MATQAALTAAIQTALTTAGYVVARSADPEQWPSWATGRFVAVLVTGDETGGIDGTDVDVAQIGVELVTVAGNIWNQHAGQQASMTLARALRVLGEGIGSGVSARLIYASTERDLLPSGLWRIRVIFNALQYDTY